MWDHSSFTTPESLTVIWSSLSSFCYFFLNPIWQSAGSDCWAWCHCAFSPFPELAWHETSASIKSSAFTTKKKREKKQWGQPARRPATIKGKIKWPPSPQETSALQLALCHVILSMMHFSHGGAKWWGWSGNKRESQPVVGGALSAASGVGVWRGSLGAAPLHFDTVGFMRRPRLMDGTPLYTYHFPPELACHLGGFLAKVPPRSLCSCRREHLLTGPVNKILPREDQNQTSLKLMFPGSRLFFYDYLGMWLNWLHHQRHPDL